jgi:hypothetical protein
MAGESCVNGKESRKNTSKEIDRARENSSMIKASKETLAEGLKGRGGG